MNDNFTMASAIRWLLSTSEEIARAGSDDEQSVDLFSLQLAESAQSKHALEQEAPSHPLQLAVFGPTQSGKSTVVNLLLQTDAAGVSALAGYTKHAQGFHVGHTGGDWLADFFPDCRKLAADDLPHDDVDCYSEQPVDSPMQPVPVTVWDSPDFDSLRAGTYKQSVVRCLGLADAALLVVSKDKYGDQAVWQVLDMVRAYGCPLLICVNKAGEHEREVIVESLLARIDEYWGEATKPSVVVLPWQPDLGEKGADGIDVTALRKSVFDMLSRVVRGEQGEQIQSLVDYAWPQWREPLIAEVNASAQWQGYVAQRGEAVVEQYTRDYLEHPQHDETFQRSLVELLALLEVPGVAGVLSKTRSLVTWPARSLLGLAGIGTSPSRDPDDSLERRLLLDLFSQSVTRLSETALDKAAEGGASGEWWRSLAACLRDSREELSTDFDQRILDYQKAFEPQIEAAAQQMYAGLQKQPVVLNSLRAARFGADAVGVAFAVKSGGLGLVDLALAPAMLSVTSLLTEGAMGKYIERVMRELRKLQLQTVEEMLIEDGLSVVLGGLPQQLADRAEFYGLDQAQFASLARALGQSPEQGLETT